MKKHSDKQKEQLEWLERYGVPNKDLLQESTPSPRARKKRRPSPPRPQDEADLEMDLHGYTIAEAMAEVESTMDAMKISGYRTLRVIHGTGNNPQASIGRQLHQNLRSIWKKRVQSFQIDPRNDGSTWIRLAK